MANEFKVKNGLIVSGTITSTGVLTVDTDILTRSKLQISNGRLFELIGTSTALNIYDASAGASRIYITDSGNIGIGTTSPTKKLEVADSDIKVNGVTIGKGPGTISGNSNHNIAFGVNNFSSYSIADRAHIGIGYNAFQNITGGYYSIAIGGYAMDAVIDPDECIAIGLDAMGSATYPGYSVAIGNGSLFSDTEGYGNIAIGARSANYLNSAFGGYGENTVVGNSAAFALKNARETTVLGAGALWGSTSHTNLSRGNTAVGAYSGNSWVSGRDNIWLGYGANGFSNGSYNVIIGANVSSTAIDGAGTLNNSIVLADGQGNVRIFSNSVGNVGIGTTSPAYKLDVTGGDVRLSQNYSKVKINGIDLLGYGSGNLWQLGNSNYSSLVLSTDWNWDTQVEFKYIPGTIGAVSGILQIGQLQKNSSTWTHGRTDFYANGLLIANVNGYGVGIGREAGSNQKFVVDVTTGNWILDAYNSGTEIGGIHVNNGILTVQGSSGNEVRLATSGNATWNGDIIATRPWVQAQGFLTSVSDVWVNTTGDTMTGSLAFINAANDVRINKNNNWLNLYDPWNNIHLRNGNEGYGIYVDSTIHYWRPHDGSAYWMTLSSTGLGIGTGSPTAKLDVAGNGYSTDFRISRAVNPAAYFSISAPGGGPNASTIGINGVDVMTLRVDGNVGIGTTTPSALFHVANSGRMLGVLRIQGTNRTSFYDNTFAVNNDGGGADGFIYGSNVGGSFPFNGYGEVIIQANPRTGYSNGISFVTGTTSPTIKLRINESGDVGIGTTTPGQKLSVAGNIETVSGTGIKIGFNVADAFTAYGNSVAHYGISYNYGSSPLALSGYFGLGLFTNGTERLSITNPGNVGIGITSPSYKLHVNGYIGFVDSLYANSKKVIDTADSWLRLNQDGNFGSGVYTPYNLRNDGAFDNYGGIYGYNTIRGRKAQTAGNYTTAALWTESYDATTTGIAFHISGNVGKFLEMRTDGILYWNGDTIWHAGNDGSGSGLDADLLDGNHASVFATRQDGTRYTTNYNSILASGFYNGEGTPANAPNAYGQLIVAKGIDTGFQIAGGYSSNAMWFRGWGYGPEPDGFHPWRRVWHDGDFSSTNISNWNTAYGWGNHASQGYATTSYVTTQINNLVNGAPGALDTLSELASALGNDASFATTVTNSIAGKMALYNGAGAPDFNTNTTNGVYRNQGGANGPAGGTHVTMFSAFQPDGNYGWQLASSSSDNLYFRYKDANFNSWVQIASQSWVTSLGYATTSSLANYLPLAGGTMTGNITLSGGTNILFTGGSHSISGNSTGYLHFHGYTNVYFNEQLVIRGGIQNDGGNVLIDDNLNVNGELAFLSGGGGYTNIIRSAAYPSEGYPPGSNYWIEYRAQGGHHFILNTDGGVGAGLASMDDFVIWQGAIDGNRLLEVSNIGNLWIAGALTEASSVKLKENIETSEGNLEKVVNLRPVTYNKIGSQTTELGLIAEEVAEVYPEFVQYDENGEPVGVHYSRLTAALIGAVKELTNQVQELNKKING